MTEPLVAIYARVSSEKQEKECTIDSQIAQLKARAKDRSYAVVKLYQDNGYSGEMLARPALDRLRDDAAAGHFQRILIHSPDRLARKYLYQELVMDELRRHGITVEFLNQEPAETAEARLQLGIQGLFAEYEKAKFQERVRRGKLHKAKNGQVLGGWAPYGYRYIPKADGKAPRYEVDPDQANVVRLIFDLAAIRGLSLRQIVKELAARGVHPPQRRGQRSFWGRSTITKVIHNETYTGVTHYNKNQAVEPKVKKGANPRRLRTSHVLRPRDQWIPITVEPIISKDIFDRAQKRIAGNRAYSGAPKNQYLLRGLLRCGQCGSPLYGNPCHGRLFYRCGDRDTTAPTHCRAGMFSAKRLDSAAWSAVEEALQNPDLILAHLRQTQAAMSGQSPGQQNQAEINRHRAQIKIQEDRFLEAYAAQAITLEQLKAQMDTIKGRREALQEQESALAQDHDRKINFDDLEAVCKILARGLKKAAANFTEQQEVLRGLVTQIIVGKDSLRIRGALPDSGGQKLSIPSYRSGQLPTFEILAKI
jgi:site-specific DNA recombinase